MFKKSVLIKIIFSIFLLVVVIGFTISKMSDLQKAKTILFFCGINKDLEPSLVQFQNLIKEECFNKVYTFDQLPTKHLELMKKFNENNTDQSFTLLEDRFAIGDEDWNGSCTMRPNLPFRKLNYFLYNDNYLVVSFLTGGFGQSTWFEYYQTNLNSLKPIGEINASLETISDFFLRVQIRPEYYVQQDTIIPILEID